MSGAKSAARRWAEQEQSNFETTTLRIPEGLGFYKLQEGVVNLDIIPYQVKAGGIGPNAVKGGNPHAEAGEMYFQRTYFQYSHIGPGDHRFVAPGATFNDRDYISEVRQSLQRQPGHDPAEEKALAPKKRNLWLVYDHDEPAKGVQRWDFSFHQFGKLLIARISSSDEDSNWDLFWYTNEKGLSLRLTVKENKPYGLEVIAIDFIPRKKPQPAAIVNHGYDLDAMPIRMSYEKLKAAYLGVDEEEAPVPKTTSGAGTKARAKSEPKSKPADEPAAKPAESASAYTKGQTVTYLGDACEVVRILPDGILMLLTPDGDSLKVDSAKLDSGKKAKSEPVEEAKPLTAEAAGLEKNMDVLYQNQVCEIIKISPDGTSLTLLDAAGDSIRAVGCSDVKPVKEEKKATASKTKSAASSAPAGDDADGWEQSWQEGDEKD